MCLKASLLAHNSDQVGQKKKIIAKKTKLIGLYPQLKPSLQTFNVNIDIVAIKKAMQA